jgi:hypothetical protein
MGVVQYVQEKEAEEGQMTLWPAKGLDGHASGTRRAG